MSDVQLGQRFGLSNGAACIHCGADTPVFSGVMGAAEKAGGKASPPSPGDISLCLQCGGLQAIRDDLGGFRPLLASEAERYETDPRVTQLRKARDMATEHGGIKSATVMKRQTPAGDLAAKLHQTCIEHFGGRGRQGLTADEIVDVGAAGCTLAAVYLADLPYQRRLNVVTLFVKKMMDAFAGKATEAKR